MYSLGLAAFCPVTKHRDECQDGFLGTTSLRVGGYHRRPRGNVSRAHAADRSQRTVDVAAARVQRGERVGDVGRGVDAELGAESVHLAAAPQQPGVGARGERGREGV